MVSYVIIHVLSNRYPATGGGVCMELFFIIDILNMEPKKEPKEKPKEAEKSNIKVIEKKSHHDETEKIFLAKLTLFIYN